MRVLLIEGDPADAESVQVVLDAAGYVVDIADCGEDGLALAGRAGYELIVLDIRLPDIDGLEALRRLRAARIDTPVLVLAAPSEVEHRITSLVAGADAWLTKPFDRRELVVSIQAILRRARASSEGIVRTGRLAVDLDRRSALVDGREVRLTGKEHALLELLSRRKGAILTKEMILHHLYDGVDEPEIKIIDVFICKLRRKIADATGGEHYIKTVWGRGYVLGEADAAPSGSRPPAERAAAAPA